jgi:hypothetical protein
MKDKILDLVFFLIGTFLSVVAFFSGFGYSYRRESVVFRLGSSTLIGY